jgi:hypothetical protein
MVGECANHKEVFYRLEQAEKGIDEHKEKVDCVMKELVSEFKAMIHELSERHKEEREADKKEIAELKGLVRTLIFSVFGLFGTLLITLLGAAFIHFAGWA